MTSNFIDCSDGGKCGHRKHQIGSGAYKQCLRKKAGSVARSPFAHADVTSAPVGDKKYVDGGRLLSMTKAFRNSGSTYLQGDESFFSRVHLDDNQVQQYIDNPRGVRFSERQENRVKNSIRDNIEDIAEDADIDIDSLSTEEIDMTCQAAYNSISQRDAVYDMARGMAPRTFTYNCVDPDQPNSPGSQKTRDSFAEAMESYEVRSDEWYDTIAGGYLSDMRQQKRLTHGPAGSEDEELIAADRKAIAASLKEAIGKNAKWLNDRNLRGISVVWSGSLNDIAPSDVDSDRRDMIVQQPHIVITGAYKDEVGGDIQSTPVRLSGEYRVKVPARTYAKTGWTSGVRDDKTAGFYRLFDYSDNFDQDQCTSRGVYRAKTNN